MHLGTPVIATRHGGNPEAITDGVNGFLVDPDDPAAFLSPNAWPAHAVAMTTTHDLPTLRGFWNGADIDLRAGLGCLPGGFRTGETAADDMDLMIGHISLNFALFPHIRQFPNASGTYCYEMQSV
mgnify:CR=1 FL=1